MMDTLKPYLLLISFVAGIAVGWKVTSWHAEKEKAETELANSRQIISDMEVAAGKIVSAANDHLADIGPLRTSISALKKELKDAIPLPADCRPDDVRMRGLRDAVRAANDTGSGQVTGPAVSAD